MDYRVEALLRSDPVNNKPAQPHVALRGTESEMAARVRRGVVEVEERTSIAVILDASAERDQLHGLPHIGLEQRFRAAKIILGQDGSLFRIPDVTAEARRSVGVAALSHIIGKKLVIVGEFPAAMRRKEVARRAGVIGHPKSVQVGDAIVRSARLDHLRLVFDHQRRSQFGPEPERASSGNVDVENPIAGFDFSRPFEFGSPLRERSAKIVEVELRSQGERGVGWNSSIQGNYANPDGDSRNESFNSICQLIPRVARGRLRTISPGTGR